MADESSEAQDPQSHPDAPHGTDVAQLQAELDEARSRALRLMADFQNYQRRAHQNEAQAKREGVASAVAAVVPVLDHFDNALCMDTCAGSAEQVMQGVRVIRDEMLKALGQLGVTLISPRANDDFEPGKHEAVMQRPSEGVEPGRIVQTFQAGYLLGSERVLRPAKVVVAPTGA